MSRQVLYIIAFVLVLLSGIQETFCQAPVSLKTAFNRKKILIGEPVALLLELKAPIGADVGWFQEDSITHFEFVDKGKVDSTLADGMRVFTQNVVVTSFDSGTWVFPALRLQVNGTTYLTDTAVIAVNFSKFNPGADYHDIKDIVDVPNPYARYIIWVVIALTILSIAAVAWFILKTGTQKENAPVIVLLLSPYDEAVKALAELKAQNLDTSGEVKLFYTRLNDILRHFIFRKLEIPSLVKTNEELIMQLRTIHLPAEQFSQLSEALRMSDFVKFAKYLPDEKDNEQNFSVIRSSVEILNTSDKQ